MSRRQEFSRAVRVEIVRRATRDSVVYCEECGLPAKRFDIDHVIPDGLRGKPTAANGRLLCSGEPLSCHARKTALDVAAIAKAKRREAKDIRAARPKQPILSRGFAPADKTKPPTREPALGAPGMARRFV